MTSPELRGGPGAKQAGFWACASAAPRLGRQSVAFKGHGAQASGCFLVHPGHRIPVISPTLLEPEAGEGLRAASWVHTCPPAWPSAEVESSEQNHGESVRVWVCPWAV